MRNFQTPAVLTEWQHLTPEEWERAGLSVWNLLAEATDSFDQCSSWAARAEKLGCSPVKKPNQATPHLLFHTTCSWTTEICDFERLLIVGMLLRYFSKKYRSTIVFCLINHHVYTALLIRFQTGPLPISVRSCLSGDSMYGVTIEAVPAPVSPRVIPAYLFHQANEVFSDCSLVCWFFLVMSTSCMWHVAPWGNRARRLAPTARQTKCVCLCSSVSLRCVHRQLSEKDSMIAALWLSSCISSEFISFWFRDFE